MVRMFCLCHIIKLANASAGYVTVWKIREEERDFEFQGKLYHDCIVAKN